jgi:hypothetical protein
MGRNRTVTIEEVLWFVLFLPAVTRMAKPGALVGQYVEQSWDVREAYRTRGGTFI